MILDLEKRRVRRIGECLSTSGFFSLQTQIEEKYKKFTYYEHKTKSYRITPPYGKIELYEEANLEDYIELDGKFFGIIFKENSSVLYEYFNDEIISWNPILFHPYKGLKDPKQALCEFFYQGYRIQAFGFLKNKNKIMKKKKLFCVKELKLNFKFFDFKRNQVKNGESEFVIQLEISEKISIQDLIKKSIQSDEGVFAFEIPVEERQDQTRILVLNLKSQNHFFIDFEKDLPIMNLKECYISHSNLDESKVILFFFKINFAVFLDLKKKSKICQIEFSDYFSLDKLVSTPVVFNESNFYDIYFLQNLENSSLITKFSFNSNTKKITKIENFKTKKISKNEKSLKISKLKNYVYYLEDNDKNYSSLSLKEMNSQFKVKSTEVKGTNDHITKDIPQHEKKLFLRSRIEEENILLIDGMVKGSIKSSVYSFDFAPECLRNCFFWRGRLYKERGFGVVEDIFAIKTHFRKDYYQNLENIFGGEIKTKNEFFEKIIEILKNCDFHIFLICEKILNLSWILVLFGDKDLLKLYLHHFYEYFKDGKSIRRINFIEKMMKKFLPLKKQNLDFMKSIEELKFERIQDHLDCDIKETEYRIKKEEDVKGEKIKFWTIREFKEFNKTVKNVKKLLNPKKKKK